jgi:uncharacterized protein (DUF305 family)
MGVSHRRWLVLALTVAGPLACRTTPGGREAPLVQPGAPGTPARDITAGEAADLSQLRSTAAEIRFVEGMIPHHEQALSMTRLIAARTSSQDIQLLGKRIELSQADEIEMMRGWLISHGVPPPDTASHTGHDPALMPGMLTADEMQRLADARGTAFDRLFLELMIRHHEGALVMVEELFSSAGAGQQSDIFAFASDVEADQQIEIDRMSVMLEERAK